MYTTVTCITCSHCDLTSQCQTVQSSCILLFYFYKFYYCDIVVIRLEARLQPNIGFTLAVFMRSAVTPPKVNRFG